MIRSAQRGPASAALVFTVFGFATARALVGTRFPGSAWKDLRALGLASLCVTSMGLAVAAACAGVIAQILGRPFAEVLVAYAPGGVEAMAPMAVSLGYDPVFISSHHIFRILLLFVTLLTSAIRHLDHRAHMGLNNRIVGWHRPTRKGEKIPSHPGRPKGFLPLTIRSTRFSDPAATNSPISPIATPDPTHSTSGVPTLSTWPSEQPPLNRSHPHSDRWQCQPLSTSPSTTVSPLSPIVAPGLTP